MLQCKCSVCLGCGVESVSLAQAVTVRFVCGVREYLLLVSRRDFVVWAFDAGLMFVG